mmetsp:Transcript_61624/g.127333  ORF Transcript_61624/g.127333 Transcript_61624/m.127333 type:complete len:421 (+) Transcript_61624:198-1460(+)
MGVATDFEIPASEPVDLRLHWDFGEQETIDLDCSAVLFDECGFVLDAAFYNNLTAANGAIKHSGEKDTKLPDKANEQITFDLAAIPSNVTSVVLVVNAFCGSTLFKLETAFVRIAKHNSAGNAHLHEMSVCGGKGGAFRETGVVLGVIQRNKGKPSWRFIEKGTPCAGKNFVECLPTIQAIVDEQIEPGIVAERAHRVLNVKHTFMMRKGNVAEIPEQLAQHGLFVGLGWSCRKDIDLDASIIATNQAGKVVGTTYFKDKTGIPGTRHQGDNLTGEGEGDDEVIDINLNKIQDKVASLYVVVNIYSRASFGDVHDSFVRLVSKTDNKVLNYYKLDSKIASRGLVFLRIFRRPLGMGWAVEALGKGCEGNTAMSRETVRALTSGPEERSTKMMAQAQGSTSNFTIFLVILVVLGFSLLVEL